MRVVLDGPCHSASCSTGVKPIVSRTVVAASDIQGGGQVAGTQSSTYCCFTTQETPAAPLPGTLQGVLFKVLLLQI